MGGPAVPASSLAGFCTGSWLCVAHTPRCADRYIPLRIPVFARGSNPAIDPPILRKSAVYCERQVLDRLADWLNPDDRSAGIIAREYLPRETPPVYVPTPEREWLPPVEVSGCVFEDPEQSAEKLAERARLLQGARTVVMFGNDKELQISAQ